MAQINMCSSLITYLEKIIEEKFSQEPAYLQTKAMMEGKVAQVDVKSLADDSRAMFAGNNKPEAIFASAVDYIQNRVVDSAELMKSQIKESQDKLKQNMMEANKIIQAMAEKKAPGSPGPTVEEKVAIGAIAEGAKATNEIQQYTIALDKSTDNIKATFDSMKKSFVKI